MRGIVVLAAALFAGATADAADLPDGWTPLSAGGLSVDAPAHAGIDLAQDPGLRTWRLRAPDFLVTIRAGAAVSDGDDSEPKVCYRPEPVVVDGRSGVLRVSRDHPRLDCPDNYASLFIAADRPGGQALYLSAQAQSHDDLAAVRTVISTLHLAQW